MRVARREIVAMLAVAAALALGACVSSTQQTNQASPAVEGAPPGDRADPRARARARTDLAAAYYERGNLAVALEEVRLALDTDPSFALAHNVLGLIRMDMNEAAAAQSAFERALALDPNDPDIAHNYGWFLCQSGRETQSVDYFMRAIRNPLYRSAARSHAAAGVCLARAKQQGEALGHLDRALRIDPNYAPAMVPLAQLQFERGDLEQARTVLLRHNAQFAPTAESVWLLLRVERRRGDAQAEASLATQLRRRFPESREFDALQRGQF